MGLDGDTAERAGNVTKEVVSNLYTNDAAKAKAAENQAKRIKKTPTESKFLKDLQNKIADFKKTKKKVDLR